MYLFYLVFISKADSLLSWQQAHLSGISRTTSEQKTKSWGCRSSISWKQGAFTQPRSSSAAEQRLGQSNLQAASPREILQGPGTNFTDPKVETLTKDSVLCIPLHSFAVWCCRMLSIPLTYGYIFGCVNRIQLYSINHPFEEKQKKANQNDSRKSDFGKNTKKGKYEKYKCRTQWKIQRTLCFFACVVALFLSFFLACFCIFSEKRSEQKQQKKLLFNVFLLFSCGFFLNVLFVFCFFQLHFVTCVGWPSFEFAFSDPFFCFFQIIWYRMKLSVFISISYMACSGLSSELSPLTCIWWPHVCSCALPI